MVLQWSSYVPFARTVEGPLSSHKTLLYIQQFAQLCSLWGDPPENRLNIPHVCKNVRDRKQNTFLHCFKKVAGNFQGKNFLHYSISDSSLRLFHTAKFFHRWRTVWSFVGTKPDPSSTWSSHKTERCYEVILFEQCCCRRPLIATLQDSLRKKHAFLKDNIQSGRPVCDYIACPFHGNPSRLPETVPFKASPVPCIFLVQAAESKNNAPWIWMYSRTMIKFFSFVLEKSRKRLQRKRYTSRDTLSPALMMSLSGLWRRRVMGRRRIEYEDLRQTSVAFPHPSAQCKSAEERGVGLSKIWN